jgi:hypothetical protein
MTFEDWFKAAGYDQFDRTREAAEAAWDYQQERIDELESEIKRLRLAALDVVSWDWRELQKHSDHIDWIPALRAIDNLEKALEGSDGICVHW